MANKCLMKHNITAKTWRLSKKDKQRLKAAQMTFLRPLQGYIKLDL
jgi:hypothetical protein